MSNVANLPIVTPAPAGAPVPAGDLDGLAQAVDGAITEAEMVRRLGEGAEVRDVVVIYRRPSLAGGGVFVPYFRLTRSSGHLAIALYRERGLRSFKAFDRLLALLDTWGYRGPVRVLWDDDPSIPGMRLAGTTPPSD